MDRMPVPANIDVIADVIADCHLRPEGVSPRQIAEEIAAHMGDVTAELEAEVKRLREAATQDGYKIAALNGEVERLQEALRLIRGRYFPADDDARIVWANETFKIARDALGDDR